MRLLIAFITAAALGGLAVSAAPSPVAALAGRYSHHFKNGDVFGGSYFSDDVAEIVPVNPYHAYVRFTLAFFNGHECSLSGVAEAKGDTLVYTAPTDSQIGSGPDHCRLTVRRTGAKLAWDDAFTCKSYCGARGSFTHGSIDWASRRPIAYTSRLKSSREYRDALTEWHTGHAANP